MESRRSPGSDQVYASPIRFDQRAASRRRSLPHPVAARAWQGDHDAVGPRRRLSTPVGLATGNAGQQPTWATRGDAGPGSPSSPRLRGSCRPRGRQHWCDPVVATPRCRSRRCGRARARAARTACAGARIAFPQPASTPATSTPQRSTPRQAFSSTALSFGWLSGSLDRSAAHALPAEGFARPGVRPSYIRSRWRYPTCWTAECRKKGAIPEPDVVTLG